MTTMNTIQKTQAAEGFEIKPAPIPTIQPNEVLVKVLKTSICGTDLHITQWDAWSASRIKPPMVFGHEFCGTIEQVGSQVADFKTGDYVSAEMHLIEVKTGERGTPILEDTGIIYGVDRPGCFAEYIALPAQQLVKLSDKISPEVGACLDSLGNATYAVSRGKVDGKTVLITGCGPIGLYAIPVAKALGATKVFASDVTPYRLDLARKANADMVLDASQQVVSEAIKQATDGEGVDVVIDMSGNPRAIQDGFEALKQHGTFVMLGIPPGPIELDINRHIIFKQARVVGVTGRHIFDTWDTMIELLESGKVDISFIITHQLAMDQFGEGIEAMKKGAAGKIILDPHRSSTTTPASDMTQQTASLA